MSIIASSNFFTARNSRSGYDINQSLRFNSADSAGLTRTQTTNNESSDFTISFWVKKAYNGDNNMMLLHLDNGSVYSYISFGESTSDEDLLTARGTASGYAFRFDRKYRDNSAWYHVVLSVDAGTITKGWINGVLDRDTGATSGWRFNGAYTIGMGRTAAGSNYFNGYLAEFHFIDGAALDPYSFGETDTITGAWIPKKYSGSYGTNGYYLKFDPSATNGIGHDHSGNGNNWTATGFSTSGTGTDVMSDTPTTNYATVNPLHPSGTTGFSDGNLRNTFSNWLYDKEVDATFHIPNSGKYYFEVQATGGSSQNISGQERTYSFGLQPVGKDGLTELIGWYASGSTSLYVGNNTATTASGTTMSNNTVMMCAVDVDSGKVWMGKDGSWYDTATSTNGNPSSGTNQSATLTANKTYVPSAISGCDPGTTSSIVWNFGQRNFSYTPPTGFKALNTANLPEPTIKKGSKYFDTKLYSGNTSTNAITGFNFSPDFVWIKSRSHGSDNALYDIVRGTNKELRTNLTQSEWTFTDSLNSFDTNGFTLGTDTGNGNVNLSGRTYVTWAWDANGAGSSNTAGSITSTVSANATAGFSVVSYAGGQGSTFTVGHGLNVQPAFVITKARNANDNWGVYYTNNGVNTNWILLNSTAAQGTNNGPLTGGAYMVVSSTTLQIASSAFANGGSSMIAYCFSEVAGYSKFGSYTGNGSTDGPFVFAGMRPRWVLTKRTDSTSAWYLHDTARNTYNVANLALSPDLSDAEVSANNNLDILSNGFKLRTTGAWMNASGGTYIFAAFAELPFKYANAR